MHKWHNDVKIETGSFENFNSDLRNVPKRLRKTVIYFNNKYKCYNLEVNLETALCAIYMFALQV